MYGGLAYGWGAYGQGYLDEKTAAVAKGYAKASDALAASAKAQDA